MLLRMITLRKVVGRHYGAIILSRSLTSNGDSNIVLVRSIYRTGINKNEHRQLLLFCTDIDMFFLL